MKRLCGRNPPTDLEFRIRRKVVNTSPVDVEAFDFPLAGLQQKEGVPMSNHSIGPSPTMSHPLVYAVVAGLVA